MPVEQDDSGKRHVSAEVEVPGSPDEVWDAIATGPGITAWFVPTELDGQPGGQIVCHFGPGMDSVSTVREWQPPHRFLAENPIGPNPDDPTVATEWTVTANDNGTCTIRVVHSWFSSKADWDDQFGSAEMGWVVFFRVLRAYLADFRGQAVVPVPVMGFSANPAADTWTAVGAQLGFAHASAGQRITSPAGAPPASGTVVWTGEGADHTVLIRTEGDTPGLASIGLMAMGPGVFITATHFLYGERGASAAEIAAPAWQAWIAEHYPMPAMPS